MFALGRIDDLETVADGFLIARTVTPDPAHVARYDDVAARYVDLVERLEPLLREQLALSATGSDEQEI
jgi:sugar (pentulose or hexulose) kinase